MALGDEPQDAERHSFVSYSSEKLKEDEQREAIEDQLDLLTKRLHDAFSDLQKSRFETESSVVELNSVTEQLVAANVMKEQLAEALEHEQNQRAALLETVRKINSDKSEVSQSEVLQIVNNENSSLQKEVGNLRKELQMQVEKENTLCNEVFVLRERLASLETRCGYNPFLSNHSDENQKVDAPPLKSVDNHEEEINLKDSVRLEISRLYDRFEEFLAGEKAEWNKIIEAKDQEIRRLKTECAYITEQLEKKDTQLVSQASLLISLNSSLDRLISS